MGQVEAGKRCINKSDNNNQLGWRNWTNVPAKVLKLPSDESTQDQDEDDQ